MSRFRVISNETMDRRKIECHVTYINTEVKNPISYTNMNDGHEDNAAKIGENIVKVIICI